MTWIRTAPIAKGEKPCFNCAAGNFGDCKPAGGGVWEMRIDHGPGYRMYCAMAGQTCVLLLCGRDKRKQSADIVRAAQYWSGYQRRVAEP